MTLEGAAPPGLGPHSREKELADFEAQWQPVNLLKKHHKDAVKYYYSLKQGRDGARALCYRCNVEFALRQLQIHHIDHNRRNNQLSNLIPHCEPCQNDEHREWLKGRSHSSAGSVTTLKKENDTEMQNPEKLTYNQLLKQAPPTFQAKVKYREETLAYLKQYVTETKSFETATFDIEAITGCSHGKAIEYLNAFSVSVFAPWRQWTTQEGQWIAPREGSEAYRKVMGK